MSALLLTDHDCFDFSFDNHLEVFGVQHDSSISFSYKSGVHIICSFPKVVVFKAVGQFDGSFAPSGF